jgi:hypothetical protein
MTKINNIDKDIEKAVELAKKFEERTNQILNDTNIPQELKDIILETRIPDEKIIDLSGGKRIKRIDPETFEIEYE